GLIHVAKPPALGRLRLRAPRQVAVAGALHARDHRAGVDRGLLACGVVFVALADAARDGLARLLELRDRQAWHFLPGATGGDDDEADEQEAGHHRLAIRMMLH